MPLAELGPAPYSGSHHRWTGTDMGRRSRLCRGHWGGGLLHVAPSFKARPAEARGLDMSQASGRAEAGGGDGFP